MLFSRKINHKRLVSLSDGKGLRALIGKQQFQNETCKSSGGLEKELKEELTNLSGGLNTNSAASQNGSRALESTQSHAKMNESSMCCYTNVFVLLTWMQTFTSNARSQSPVV